MAFKIPETEQERLNEGALELQDLRGKLEDGLQAYNMSVKAAWDKLQQHVGPYEDKARQLYDIVEHIKSAAEDEFDEQSDDWKESDSGEATQEWINALDEATTSLDVPLNLPDLEQLDAESILAEDLTEVVQHLAPEPKE